MLRNRVIPALLLQNEGLVKTTKFKNPKYVGDPINAIRIFNDKEVDELMVLDIAASQTGSEPNYQLIEELAGECFMPLAYGGGISTVEQAGRILACGVEKICLQTAALNKPQLVSDLAQKFGSQSIVVSADVKKNWFNKPKLFKAAERKIVDSDWIEYLQQQVRAGAGEILLNSVDQDGTLSGPDLDLIHTASEAIEVPLIALGGISSLADIKAAIEAGASAVAAGSFFVFHGPHRAVLITYPKYSDLEQLF
ncbi:AglZ/HisF2 family acetamidino modification protein [Thalassospira sp. SN3W]|uniref:AglZ/HisF2 family acetamidino modification protein n=1 Tax=Thalassospira sp. SN3W TaxID=3035476 RepID=UPI00311B41B6